MKRALSLILAALMLLAITACGGETSEPEAATVTPTEEPAPTPEPTPEPIVRLTQVDKYSEGSLSSSYTFTYMDDNMLLSEMSWASADGEDHWRYEYDADGRMLSYETYSNGESSPTSAQYFVYDSEGRPVKITQIISFYNRDSDGQRGEIDYTSTYVSLYTYNENGLLSEINDTKSQSTSDNEYSTTFVYEYDEVGTLVSVYTKYEDELRPYEEYTYEYDDAGRLLYMLRSAPIDSQKYEETMYSYDGEGNLTEEENYLYQPDGDTWYTKRFYDKAGNVMKEEIGSSYGHQIATYDAEGREITADTEDYHSESSYDEDRYFLLRYLDRYEDNMEDPVSSWLHIQLLNDNGEKLTTFSLNGIPELTYNDAGYLVKADTGNGNYLEITYETVG